MEMTLVRSKFGGSKHEIMYFSESAPIGIWPKAESIKLQDPKCESTGVRSSDEQRQASMDFPIYTSTSGGKNQ